MINIIMLYVQQWWEDMLCCLITLFIWSLVQIWPDGGWILKSCNRYLSVSIMPSDCQICSFINLSDWRTPASSNKYCIIPLMMSILCCIEKERKKKKEMSHSSHFILSVLEAKSLKRSGIFDMKYQIAIQWFEQFHIYIFFF